MPHQFNKRFTRITAERIQLVGCNYQHDEMLELGSDSDLVALRLHHNLEFVPLTNGSPDQGNRR